MVKSGSGQDTKGEKAAIPSAEYGSDVIADLLRALDIEYVAFNPVRAGICDQIAEYRWSSVSYHLGLKATDPVVKDRRWFGTTKNWQELLKDPTAEELKIIGEEFPVHWL